MASNIEQDKYLQKVDTIRTKDTRYSEVFRLTAVCLGVMCILQATLNITLRLHSSPEPDTELFNKSYYNLTLDELRTRYIELLNEKRQLHIVKDQLESKYNDLVKKRSQLDTDYTRLVTEKDQLMKTFPKLVDIIGLGGKYFHSKLYFISNEKRSWIQSRQDCKKDGADLVTIDSQEEEEFIIKLMGNKSHAWVQKWEDGSELITGIVEEPNNGTNEPHAENTRWTTMPCLNKEWWVCEKTVFE